MSVLIELFVATGSPVSRSASARVYGRGVPTWQPKCRRPRPRPRASCTAAYRLSWRQHHHHLAAFEPRFHLNLGDLDGVVLDAIEQLDSELLVRHFAAAKAQGDLDLMAFLEEALHRAHLHVVIVVI